MIGQRLRRDSFAATGLGKPARVVRAHGHRRAHNGSRDKRERGDAKPDERDAMPGRRPTPLRNAAAAVFRHLADFLDPPGVSRAGGALLG